MGYIIKIAICSIIALYVVAICFRLYRVLNTTLRTKTEGHSDAELWALSWCYWLEEMHKKDVTPDRATDCFDHARQSRTALVRELGDADWFIPEPDKQAKAAESTPEQEEQLPDGVSSFDEYKKSKQSSKFKNYDDDDWDS